MSENDAELATLLTGARLSQSRVIAKGLRIREVKRLVQTYGGRESSWSKKSSPTFVLKGKIVEIHWYEHPGVGRRELKLKPVAR